MTKLKQLLSEDILSFAEEAADWKEAIRLAAKPLLVQGYISPGYIAKMISNVEEFGPYIHITGRLAMPHARPEDGAKKSGISILVLKQPVSLLDEDSHSVSVFICLACADSAAHLELISELTEFLTVNDNMSKIEHARDGSMILSLLD